MLRDIRKRFINELGNEIHMSVSAGPRGVVVKSEGPTSTTDHTWTMVEAIELYRMLGETIGHRSF